MHNNYSQFVFHLLIAVTQAIRLQSNYNYSFVSEQALLADPTILPVRLLSSQSYKTHLPLLQTFNLRKHQLRDTDYHLQQQNLQPFDEQLVYNMQPPAGVFAFDIITVENYRLLEMRWFPIVISNPSRKFRFCITNILTDTEEIRRVDERGSLPLCLPPVTSYAFNFTLYVADLNPQYVRAAVYFFIQLYDGQRLVEEKIYPRRIFASVTPNHLRLESPYFRNCPASQQVLIKNYQIFDIFVRVDHKKRLFTSEGVSLDNEVRIAPTKSIKIELEGRAIQLIIHIAAADTRQHNFPPLLLKTYCEQLLNLDYYNIGVIPDERMVMEVPVSVSSQSSHNITIEEIIVQATSEAVLLQQQLSFGGTVAALHKNVVVALMRVHSRAKPEKNSGIMVKVRYRIGEEEFVTTQRYRYCQIRHPIAVGQKRFVDVTKLNHTTQLQPINRISQNRFPIRNNLNIPLYLLRVIYDQSLFQLSWLQDRRNFIFPNHNREQFLFSYSGPLTLPISSTKHVILLEFNGHIFVPIEVVIYDHTLQCILEGIVSKCANLSTLDYGYFRDRKAKIKQMVIRNWNPESKNLLISFPEEYVEHKNINITLHLHTPLPSNDPFIRRTNHSLELYLKGQQFVVLSIEIELQGNATSQIIPLQLQTSSQNITMMLQIRVENGTIALIPQVIRLRNAFMRTVEYLNLVSTFTQKYKIDSLTSNLSTLSVYSNNYSDIIQNQWVGIVVVYDPYMPPNNITLASWSLLEQQRSYIAHRLNENDSKTIYAKIKLTTSTELQVSSTVIIDNNSAPLIAEATQSSTFNSVYNLKRTLMKRCKKSPQKVRNKKREGHDNKKQVYQMRFSLMNSFPQSLKYKIYLLSEPKFDYLSSFTSLRELYLNSDEDCFFCIPQNLVSRHSITAQLIKSIMRTSSLPEQCTLEFKDELFVFNMQKERIVILNSTIHIYLLKSYGRSCRHCYRFRHNSYIHRLINSEVPNKVIQQHNFPLFAEFMRLEIAHMESVSLFQLDYADTHSAINDNFNTLCQQHPDLLAFMFCHFLNVKVQAIYHNEGNEIVNHQIKVQPGRDQTYVLSATKSHQMVIQLVNPSTSLDFYVIIANNYTKYESYKLSMELAEPKLIVSHIHLDNGLKIDRKQFELHYFQDYNHQNRDKRLSMAGHLPIYLIQDDYSREQDEIVGSRTFQILNDGEADVVISQIGIEEMEIACQHKGIRLTGLNCEMQKEAENQQWQGRDNYYKNNSSPILNSQPFTINRYSKYNLTIHFHYSLDKSSQQFSTPSLQKDLQSLGLFLYDEHGYYFKLTVIFKIADQDLKLRVQEMNTQMQKTSLMSVLTINCLSLLVVSIMLLRLKSDENKKNTYLEDQSSDGRLNIYRKLHRFRFRRLGKILKESSYSNTDSSIGAVLPRRQSRKLVQSISEDLLLSVKQVKQRQLKKFFNESQQSQIGELLGGINHHLSLSQSISYDQEEHDINQHQNQKIIELVDISKEEEEEEEEENSKEQDQEQENDDNIQNEELQSSEKVVDDELPEGEEVDLTDKMQEDSWYDFNREINSVANKSNSNTDLEEDEFYNIFRSEIGLKKLKVKTKHE